MLKMDENKYLKSKTLIKRFTDKLSILESGCWQWNACIATNGYGRFGWGAGRHIPAHRYSYEKFFGNVPEGFVLDHTCNNKWCVNPNHLEPVTHSENLCRGFKRIPRKINREQNCKNGHPVNEENRKKMKNPRAYVCKICHRDKERDRYRAKIK